MPVESPIAMSLHEGKTASCSEAESRDPVGSSTERAYAELKRQIMEGIWAPGKSELEGEIASRLGMSRTPTREALVRLEREGLVALIPRRGAHVAPLSEQDVSDTYYVLAGLEAMAAELITKGPNLNLVVAQLALIVERMDQAVRRKDLRGWAQADAAFHDALIKGAGNRRLEGLAELVTVLAMRARMVTLPYRPLPQASNAEHADIIKAINSGNWKTAARVTREHRMRGLQTILKALHRMPRSS